MNGTLTISVSWGWGDIVAELTSTYTGNVVNTRTYEHMYFQQVSTKFRSHSAEMCYVRGELARLPV